MRSMIRGVLTLALGLLAVDAASTGGAPQSGMATITGTVTLTAMRFSTRTATAYARRGVAPKRTAAWPEVKNVVVYVDGGPGEATPAPMRARIVQRDEEFVPRVAAVPVGSTVEFPNDDPFFHNVFSLSKAATFDLGRYPSGTSKAVTVGRPGIVKVFCHLHSQMTALILVLPHASFAIPDADGSFTLPPVRGGELTVVAWHERIGEHRERVRVTPGSTTQLSFTIPVFEDSP